MTTTLYTGISQCVMPHLDETGAAPLHVLNDAALLVADGLVRAIGARHELAGKATHTVDLGGRAVIPGLVDSHTHVVFAGTRVDEMARRARGETYEEIARAGGGIARSVTLMAEATLDSLVAQSLPRVRTMLARGTTTAEVKSGYGLMPEVELKQLRAIKALQAQVPVQLLPTVLAHIVPAAYRDDRATYVKIFCRDILAVAASENLARHVDVFVESGAFTADEARTIAAVARQHKLPMKLHVDQLRDGSGAALAAALHALSADHLEYSNAAGRAAMAQAKVVSTILPGCALFLGKGPWPDGRALRDAGCEVAVATDCNPGSSMVYDLLLCTTLAATRCGLTLEEALWGATRGGAKALGLSDRGTLRAGERADFVVLSDPDWRAALYTPGSPPIGAVVVGGALAYGAF